MASSSYDCIVIGSGPGGYVAAIRAAQLGMKTAVVEKDQVGGRCLNYACIPAKAVLRAADILTEVRDADEFGIKVGEPEVDYGAIMERRRKVIKTLTGGVGGLFKKNGIDLIEGHGVAHRRRQGRSSAVGGDEIEVGQVRRPRHRLGAQADPRHARSAAASSAPRRRGRSTSCPPASPSSAPAPRAPRSPRPTRGSAREVVLLEALDRVLPTEDADVSKLAERGFKRQGIEVVTGTPVENVEAGDSQRQLQLRRQAGRGRLARHRRRARPGHREPRPRRRGHRARRDGLIKVDGALRTSREGVYAIGDIVPGPALAHKASDEGIIAVEDAAGEETHPIEYPDIPRATFCTPNVGSLRPHRGAGARGRPRRRRRQAASTARSAAAPSTAIAAASSRSSATRSTARCSAGTSSASRATELIQELVNVKALEGGYGEVARIIHGHPDAVGGGHGGRARRRRLADPRVGAVGYRVTSRATIP